MDFWFEYASTYSYLAAERVEDAAARTGVALRYRPFLLGPIFKAQGWNDSPFNLYEAKGRYMWRDLERLTADLNLPFRRPRVFPRNGLLAARATLALAGHAPMGPFVREVYRANFARDEDISDPAVLAAILRGLGLDARALLEEAGSDPVKRRLREQTEQAAARGIFGAPSFTVGDELFWGHDRLDAAIAWALARAGASGGSCGFPNDF